MGTGCNRAILSALDTTWMMKDLLENPDKIEELQKKWNQSYRIMVAASPEDLQV